MTPTEAMKRVEAIDEELAMNGWLTWTSGNDQPDAITGAQISCNANHQARSIA